MTRRVLPGMLVALTMVAVVLLSIPPTRVEAPPASRPRPAGAPSTSATADPAAPVVRRDLLRYGMVSTPTAPPVATRAPTVAAVTPAPEATAPPVKLVGVVRKGGSLRAAVAVDGEVVLAVVGQTVGGYTLVSIDPDEGVALTGPDGQRTTLRVEER
jgi:hypothetical protein